MISKKLILLLTLFTLYTLNTHYTLSQWVQQSVPVSKPIQGIKFIDSLKGWACTSLGTGGLNYSYILHTINGGTNWFIQDSSFNSDYNALSVVDANITYAGGDSVGYGKLAKTTDGGLNWVYLQLPINMLIGDMQFLNKDSGWTCVDLFGPDVRTTTNGGLNWIVRTNGIASQTQRIFFLNYSTGFCVTAFDLYKTTNAGQNWFENGNFSNNIKSVFFLNENTGWIGATSNKIFFTSNSGINWVTQTTPSFAGTITDIHFINSQTGWGGLSYIIVCKTTNGGINWGYQMDTSQSNRLAILDSLRGWTGQFGISHTINGGGPIIYTGFVSNGAEIPKKIILYQNYPNPFNPTTTIRVDLPKSSNINLVVCDMLGRELYIITSQYLKAGTYTFTWDPGSYSSGIYFYRFTAENYTETKKMILIK